MYICKKCKIMLILKRITTYIFTLFVFQLGYAQFPPPENLIATVNGDDPILSWDAPSKDLAYYNIYRNNLLIDNTTELEYTDTIQFVYSNEWYVTAVYANPNGESEPSNTSYIFIGIAEEIPYYENFDLNYAWWATRAITGQKEWELVDTTSFSGVQCAGFYPTTYGDKSVLYSCPIGGYLLDEIELSFWYKCPEKNNISDELQVYRIEWPQDTIYLSEILTNQNQWTEKKINLGDIDGLALHFESTSKGGGGIFIDSIKIVEILTSTEEIKNYHKLQLYQNFPNPFSYKTRIGFHLPKDDQVKISIYCQNGQKLKTILDEKLMQGEHFVDFHRMDLSSGVYYYSLKTSKQKVIKKFIIY